MVRLGTALRGGVHEYGVLLCSSTGGAFLSVGFLFPWVLEIMLSGPRLLLSDLALGMCVLGLCYGSTGPVFPLFVFFVRPPVGFLVSFVLPLSFGSVISLYIFMAIGSAGMGEHRWWIRGYPEAALPLSILWSIFFVVLFILLLQLAAGS